MMLHPKHNTASYSAPTQDWKTQEITEHTILKTPSKELTTRSEKTPDAPVNPITPNKPRDFCS
jgi:hypothetical protein